MTAPKTYTPEQREAIEDVVRWLEVNGVGDWTQTTAPIRRHFLPPPAPASSDVQTTPNRATIEAVCEWLSETRPRYVENGLVMAIRTHFLFPEPPKMTREEVDQLREAWIEAAEAYQRDPSPLSAGHANKAARDKAWTAYQAARSLAQGDE